MISKVKQRIKYVAVDLFTANIVILLFDVLRFYNLPPENIGIHELGGFLTYPVLIIEQLVLPVLLVCVYGLSGYYNQPFQKSRIQEFITTALTQVANTLMIYFALLTNQATSVRSTNYEMILYLYVLLLLFTYMGRWAVTYRTHLKFKQGKLLYNVLVAGSPQTAPRLALRIRSQSTRSGMHFAGYVCTEGELEMFPKDAPAYYPEELYGQTEQLDIQEVLLAPDDMKEPDIFRLIHRLFPLNVPLKISPECVSALNSNIRLQSIYEEPYIDASTANVSEFTKNTKRLLDICVSFFALVILFVPILIIAILVRRDSKGPVFFSQERIGHRQKPFRIFKFRTMNVNAEASGPQLSSETDSRVTRIGAVLRKYRLDELPQFWNVLRGDMSLVGPRPERRFFINKIMASDPTYALVHQVRPGITSWGMVKYGYASNVEQMIRRLRYDLIYISNMSISVDIKILIYTFKTVIKGRGM